MKIKIWNFNFLSEDENELDFIEYKMKNRFDRFYMDGKEDTLFVKDKFKFEEVDRGDYKYEKELLEKYYIIDYHLLIRNKINSFIKQKAMELYTNNNYSRYELYNLIKFDDLNKLEQNAKSQFWYNEKITKENKIVYEIEGGYNLIFDPYTEEIENIETLYEQKLFSNEINNNLILLEIESNKAPEFIKHILDINKFLKEKKNVNLLFENGDTVKTNARIGSIFELWGNKISLEIDFNNYEIKDLRKITFNRKEIKIDSHKLMNWENQLKEFKRQSEEERNNELSEKATILKNEEIQYDEIEEI